MPSIIPGYVYSLFAALIVGTIIVCSCSAIMLNIKNKAETQQLDNINEYIATQSLTLISETIAGNLNSTQYLSIPTQIGTQQYWVRIANDSKTTWIASGFGTKVIQSQQNLTIPATISASGTFLSNSGRAFLNCQIENRTIVLTLTNG
jgi:hypothetical protein